MYINSEEVLNRINEVSNQIQSISNGEIVYEEYITLPYYGNIILRFNLNKDNYTLEDLDNYEKLMYQVVGNEFLIDFMGSVYKKVGLKPEELVKILPVCYEKYQDEEIIKANYFDNLVEDAKYLLDVCGLDNTLDIWELQLEDEINLFVLKDENKVLGTYDYKDTKINVYEINRKDCEGLMKTTMYSKRNHISLVRALLEV